VAKSNTSIVYIGECLELDGTSPSGLRWKHRPLAHFLAERAWRAWNTEHAGKPAGTLDHHGYWQVGGEKYQAHRVVFALTHGRWPDNDVDHENRDRASNEIENLRDATASQNEQNTKLRADNTSGTRGVWLHKGTRRWAAERWVAEIMINRRKVCLGYFDTFDEARAARCAAEILLHPFRPKPKPVDLTIPDGPFVDGCWSIEGKSTIVKGLAKPTWTTSALTVFTYGEAA
jgi:hypothetical protein